MTCGSAKSLVTSFSLVSGSLTNPSPTFVYVADSDMKFVRNVDTTMRQETMTNWEQMGRNVVERIKWEECLKIFYRSGIIIALIFFALLWILAHHGF